MKKELPYIFLPTEKASNIYLQNGKMCYDETIVERIKDCNDHFLYIISDEEIKEGDWFYNTTDGAILNKPSLMKMPSVRKIIATTNPELLGHYFSSDPQVAFNTPNKISQSDIQYIIELYNGKNKNDKLKVARNVLSADKRFSEKDLDNIMFGYELALKDNADKKFTLEEIKEALRINTILINKDNSVIEQELFFQSLTKQQSKRDTVMVEYEETHEPYPDKFYPTASKSVWRPKLKDGCIVIIK